MPIPNEYKEIIKTLFTASKEGRVKWASTGIVMEVVLLGSHFNIWAGIDQENGQGFVSVSLTSTEGKPLDTWYVDEDDSDFTYMQSVYEAAKRQALGIPNLLASIQEAINSATIIGD
jgi:hypothetical protein